MIGVWVHGNYYDSHIMLRKALQQSYDQKVHHIKKLTTAQSNSFIEITKGMKGKSILLPWLSIQIIISVE